MVSGHRSRWVQLPTPGQRGGLRKKGSGEEGCSLISKTPPNHPKGRKEGPGGSKEAPCSSRRTEKPLDPTPLACLPHDLDSFLKYGGFTKCYDNPFFFFPHNFTSLNLGYVLQPMAFDTLIVRTFFFLCGTYYRVVSFNSNSL